MANKKEKEKIIAPATFKKKEEIAMSKKALPPKPKVNVLLTILLCIH